MKHDPCDLCVRAAVFLTVAFYVVLPFTPLIALEIALGVTR